MNKGLGKGDTKEQYDEEDDDNDDNDDDDSDEDDDNNVSSMGWKPMCIQALNMYVQQNMY